MSKNSSKQVPLPLSPSDPYSERFFVPHSGNVEPLSRLDEILDTLSSNPTMFFCVYLHGPAGAGKTHLIHLIARKASNLANPVSVEIFEISNEVDQKASGEEWASPLVSAYERTKASGGLLLFTSQKSPEEVTENPHVRSRLLAGQVMQLNYPQEAEFRPVIDSLLERHNMKLTEYSLEYLLRRLPRKPLSFDSIFARISEFSLAESKPAGLGVIRTVIEETAKGHS